MAGQPGLTAFESSDSPSRTHVSRLKPGPYSLMIIGRLGRPTPTPADIRRALTWHHAATLLQPRKAISWATIRVTFSRFQHVLPETSWQLAPHDMICRGTGVNRCLCMLGSQSVLPLGAPPFRTAQLSKGVLDDPKWRNGHTHHHADGAFSRRIKPSAEPWRSVKLMRPRMLTSMPSLITGIIGILPAKGVVVQQEGERAEMSGRQSSLRRDLEQLASDTRRNSC